jgi:hypothetical protein
MKEIHIFQQSIEFVILTTGTDFFPFVLKCLFYIIPPAILGNYTDLIVKILRNNKKFGNYTIYYVLLQTLIIILTLYLINLFLSNYISKINVTVAVSFFSVLYFGIQTNYISMIKEILY